MKLISKKKKIYPIPEDFYVYLEKFDRFKSLPIDYRDLLRYSNSVTLYDKFGEDSLWTTVSYNRLDQEEIENALLKIYALLKLEGEMSYIEHLRVDRIDTCLYANTRPFRIRIINSLNDNFDYFYIKNADVSRIYGLELEHILSPNRIGFLINRRTLIEEHIYGIPGDMFIENYMDESLNEIRMAKEFVKFNERCFLRLLGDMHPANYVIDITVDFEENVYRMRAIDFDQQSYESRKAIYLPQYYKENNPIIELGMKNLTWESVRQYQFEERSLINKRMLSSSFRLSWLLKVMSNDNIAPKENVEKLAAELSEHYENPTFLKCKKMGEIVEESLTMLNAKLLKNKKP